MKEFDELSREELDKLKSEYYAKYNDAHIFACVFSVAFGVILMLGGLANEMFSLFLFGFIPVIIIPIIILTSNSERLRTYYIEKYANRKKIEIEKKNTQNLLANRDFQIDKGFVYETDETINSIYIDNKNKLISVGNGEVNSVIFSFDQLVDFKVVEDGKQVVSSNVGNAVVGTLLLGGVGAIIGSQASRTIEKDCSVLELQIMIDDLNNPFFVFKFINEKVTKDSDTYQTAVKSLNDFLSLLIYAKNHSEKPQEFKGEKQKNKGNTKTKLKELKGLLDEGIITKEEYELRKNELIEKFMNE